MAKYSAEQLRQMLAKGQAMKNPAGDPSYPIADEEDLGNAIHAVGRGGANSDSIRRYIMGRAKAMGKTSMIPDTWSADGSLKEPSMSGRSYTRTFELSDISVRTEGDGRTVDAYATVFDSPAHVHDHEGEYMEVIDRNAFDRAVAAQRTPWPILFNHGRTLYGTPSERFAVPIGVSEEVRPDGRGLFTRSRYHNTPEADQVLEAIRGGSITAYSFQGAFLRSQPASPRGGYRKSHAGDLPTVRRTESTLREFGPGTFTVYKDAAITAVRASLLSNLETLELLRSDQDGSEVPGETVADNRKTMRAAYARFLSQRRADSYGNS